MPVKKIRVKKPIWQKTGRKEKVKINVAPSMLFSHKRRDCPICKKKLSSVLFYNVEVDYCPICFGMWFDEDELRWAKDEKDRDLNWMDIDLWEDDKKFKINYGARLCPVCRMPLYELYYGDSKIIVDVCGLCHGVWLDRLEFKKIMEYLETTASSKILHKYAKSLFSEMTEVFSGPEDFRDELLDFLTITRMFAYKFSTLHPTMSKVMLDLPK